MPAPARLGLEAIKTRRHCLTASDDGIALLWLVDREDTIRGICITLTRDLTSEERVQFGISDPGPTCPPQ
jgi:hypothetical protein